MSRISKNVVSSGFFILLPGLLSILVTASGCKIEEGTSGPFPGPVPISDDLFPLTVGHRFEYAGHATDADSGYAVPDSAGRYRTVWTVLANVPTPLGGTATAIQDCTTGSFMAPGSYAVDTLLVRKDTVTGDFRFLEGIGPFRRRYGIPNSSPAVASDTLIWVHVARPSYGVGGTGAAWIAYDSTFDAVGTPVRLQIFGMIEATENIADSATPPNTWSAYRSRTWRRVTVGGSIGSDTTLSRLWFAKDVGPVQAHVTEDGESMGHFRVLRSRNF